MPFGLDPATLDAIASIGFAGAAVLGLVAFARGDIRVGKLVDKDMQRVIDERNTWMERSLASDKRVDRLADAVETALSIKAPN